MGLFQRVVCVCWTDASRDAKMRVDGPAIFLHLLEFTEAYGKKIESGRERLMETARMRGQVVISAGPTAFCSLLSCVPAWGI